MNEYKKNFDSLIAELYVLQKKLSESTILLNEKEKEKVENEKTLQIINEELDKKYLQKKKITDNDKIIYIWTYLTTILCVVFLIFATLNANQFMIAHAAYQKIQYMLIYFLGNVLNFLGVIYSLKYILKIIIEKRNNKIKNTNEYKKILEEIKTKKEEKKEIEKRIKILTEDYLEATRNYSICNAAVQIKKTEIEQYKLLTFDKFIEEQNMKESKEHPKVKKLNSK